MFLFFKKRNAGDTNPHSEPMNENSDHDDHAALFEMECCNPSDEEPDNILLSSDEESDEESSSSF